MTNETTSIIKSVVLIGSVYVITVVLLVMAYQHPGAFTS
jgi:HD-like signal output (HDOD) protein